MKRTGVMVFLMLAACAAVAAANGPETYFTFKVTSPQELETLTRIISIDNVKNGVVHAYANKRELEAFVQLGYEYSVLPHPSSLIEPRMAGTMRDLADWDSYPTYDAYVSMMYQFEADYPSLCEIHSIGTSVLGREILFAEISDSITTEEDEPEVMHTGTMHGDETTGYVLLLRLIDSLLSSYGTDSLITRLVDSTEIWINPLANPDGTYRYGNHTVSGASRSNANYVDLNRNFPDPQHGDHPDGNEWQPETVAMMNLAVAHSFVISANHHGGAEVVNYPWDTWVSRHADDTWFQSISREYADSAQYHSPSGYLTFQNNGITNGYDWYPIAGGRQDYMNYRHGCREVTIELSDVKLLPTEQLPAHWDYNKVSLLNYLENALHGIRGIVTDMSSGFPLAAVIRVLGHDSLNSDVLTDPDVGDYHRMIASGIYDLEFSAAGYFTDTVWSVIISDDQATAVDMALTPVPIEPLLAFERHNVERIDPGDTVSMRITLTNAGAGNATGVSGVLSTADSHAVIMQPVSAYPAIPSSGGTETSISDYEFILSPSCPRAYVISFRLDVSADEGHADSLFFTMETHRSCCEGNVGNVDGSVEEVPDATDMQALIDHLFINMLQLDCVAEADVDQSGGADPGPGDVDISDMQLMVDHFFISMNPLPACL